MASVTGHTLGRLADRVLSDLEGERFAGDVSVRGITVRPAAQPDDDIVSFEIEAELSDPPPPEYTWPDEAVDGATEAIAEAAHRAVSDDTDTREAIVTFSVTLRSRPGAPEAPTDQ